MLQHVVICQESYVAGTRERPEVGIFTQTHSSRPPVPWGALASMGQRCPSDVSRAPTSASRRSGPARRSGGSARPWRLGDRERPRQQHYHRGRAAVSLPRPAREDGLGLVDPQRETNTAEVLAAPRPVVTLPVDVGVTRPTLPAFAVHVVLPLAADVDLGMDAAHHVLPRPPRPGIVAHQHGIIRGRRLPSTGPSAPPSPRCPR